MRRTGRLPLVVLAATVAALALGAGPASAHASFVSAQPADGARVETSPAEVVLTFSEPVTITGDSMRVLDTSGGRVDDGRPRAEGATVTIGLDAGLGPDTYIVAWRVVSTDDHPIHGATTFIVGDGPRASDAAIAGLLSNDDDGPWPALGAIARAMAYAGGLVVIGVVTWTSFVDRAPLRRHARRLAMAGAVVGVAGAVLSLPIQAALSTGLGVDAVFDASILSDVSDGPLGWGVLLAAVGFVIFALVAGRPSHASVSAAGVEAPTAFGRPLALLGAALIAVGFARSGHTESTDPTVVMYGADVVHVLTAGAWLGGIVLLAAELRAMRRGRLAPDIVAEHVDRFSRLATVVSIAAGAGGIVLAWGTVRHLDALTSTEYGQTLLIKVACVALVAVMAGVNHWWLVPAVRNARDGALRLLSSTVRVEVAGLLAAVAVTAWLVNVEPARVAAGPGLFEESVEFGAGTAVVQVDPAVAGDNVVHVYLLDEAGRQVDLDQPPTFSFRLPVDDVGPIERVPTRAGPGHYTYDGPELSLAGPWQVTITARVSTFEEATATVDVPIR